MTTLRFGIDGGATIVVEAVRLVVAGWTGRNAAAVERHVEELARLGVPRPSAVPLYYRLASTLLTQADTIEALGSASSGEVEPVLFRHEGRWWLTVGSDHTDRAAEAYSVAASKQMCAKPIARSAWPWDDVAAHADELALHSQIFENDRWVDYQGGAVGLIRPLQSLVSGLPADVALTDGLVLFCGTLAAIPRGDGEAVRPAARMRLELVDSAMSRRIEHAYEVVALPQVA